MRPLESITQRVVSSVHCGLRMRIRQLLIAAALLAPGLIPAQEPEPNVNTRYTVESVEIPSRYEDRLSDALRDDLNALVGENYDPEKVEELSRRMLSELRGYTVRHRIETGSEPESVRVAFRISRPDTSNDNVVPRLVFHSRQNFTIGIDGEVGTDNHRFSLGFLTDNDELMERYSGIRGGYARLAADGRVRAGIQVETWRSQWNPIVERALAQQNDSTDSVPGIYRKRQQFVPSVQVEVESGVTVGGGLSFQRFQMQYPEAHYENAHALIGSLEVDREWTRGGNIHTLQISYGLRVVAEALGSDYSYNRHAFDALYRLRFGRESVEARFTGGYLDGRAPLFDRFVLGNSTTLRGYNKYDLDPLGGSRMAHGSLDYRYRFIRALYDVGTIHGDGVPAKARHSIAAGLGAGRGRSSFSFLVAVPLKKGRIEPMVMLGWSF